ncbi:hypothetical protein D3C85_825520 [compost metagenome]
MVRHAAVQQLVVGFRRIQEHHAGFAQRFDRGVDVLGRHGNVLNAFAAVEVQVFLNLALLFSAFLVDRNADIAAGRRHRLGLHAGHLAFDIEVADFAEVEEALIEFRPLRHAALVHVVRQVVHQRQARAAPGDVGLGIGGIQRHEIHVVDADVANAAVAFLARPAVHQVNQRIADALDRRDIQFHRSAMRIKPPRAQFQRALVCRVRILHAESDRTDRRAMQAGEALGEGVGFGVDQEVDAALAVQGHVFVAMLGNRLESQQFEHLAQRGGVRRGIFNELEPGGAHRVVPGLESAAHKSAPLRLLEDDLFFKSRRRL